MARLALLRGGDAIDNPRSWFESLSRESVAFWEAFNTLEPIGQEWRQAAQISYLLWASNAKPSSEITEDNFMGPDFIRPPEAIKQPADDKAVASTLGMTATKHVGRSWRP